MRQLVSPAIILSRTNFGEADRILTLLTPDYGKLSLLAKGVRRVKSKLAGGIELFSVSEITFIKGRGEVGRLISTRLIKHCAHIVTDLERTMLGYELISRLNKATEDEPEPEYFELLRQVFEALNDPSMPLSLIVFWFDAQLLRLGGHSPNLRTDVSGAALQPDQTYNFNFDRMAFEQLPSGGRFAPAHVKFLRLTFAGNPPKALLQVQGVGELLAATEPLVQQLARLQG